MMNFDIDQILEFWKFVSNISNDEKPCFSTKKSVCSSSWYGSFYRYWNNESRNDCLNRISKNINKCELFIKNCIKYNLFKNKENGLPGDKYNKIGSHKMIILSHYIYQSIFAIGKLIKTYPESETSIKFTIILYKTHELYLKFKEFIANFKFYHIDPRISYLNKKSNEMNNEMNNKMNNEMNTEMDIHVYTYRNLLKNNKNKNKNKKLN